MMPNDDFQQRLWLPQSLPNAGVSNHFCDLPTFIRIDTEKRKKNVILFSSI